jgi:hypothetical protein
VVVIFIVAVPPTLSCRRSTDRQQVSWVIARSHDRDQREHRGDRAPRPHHPENCDPVAPEAPPRAAQSSTVGAAFVMRGTTRMSAINDRGVRFRGESGVPISVVKISPRSCHSSARPGHF